MPAPDAGDTRGSLADALKNMTELARECRTAAGALGNVTAAIRSMATTGAGLIRQPFQALDAGISAVQSSVARFVSHFNPGLVTQWQYAVDSLYATIGKALVPVLQVATTIIRSISSGISGTSEQGHRLIAALAAGTAGLIAFGAAVAVIEAVTTGGIAPLLVGLAGGLAGFFAVFTENSALQGILSQLTSVLSGVLDQVGGVVSQLAGGLAAFVPLLAEWAGFMGGVVSQAAALLGSLAPALTSVVMIFTEIARAVRPIYELQLGIVFALIAQQATVFATVLRAMAPAIILVTQGIGSAVKFLTDVVRRLLSLVGIAIPEFRAPEGAGGTAASPARGVTTGSIEDVLRKARENAYAIGGPGAGPKPDVEIAKNTASIATEVQQMRERVLALVGYVQPVAGLLGEVVAAVQALGSLPGRTVERIVQGAPSLPSVNDVVSEGKRLLENLDRNYNPFR